MKLCFCSIALTLVVSAAGPSSAAIVTYLGNTTGQPVYNRAIEDFSDLSAIGTATQYDVRTFSVTASGTYDFTSSAAFDSFFFLYSPGFNPVAPLTNGAIANDDLVGLNSSGFQYSLTAGVTYTAVMTGFENSDFGAYAVSIGGVGDFTPIASTTASPDVFVSTGDTAGGPVYNRPIEDLSALSAIGTATAYEVIAFTVDTTGNYDLTSSAEFDIFLTLYQFAFDPNAALTNALVANDDLVGLNSSGFQYSLTPGVDYFAVVTGFGNTDFGHYALHVAGEGRVAPIGGAVPEPASWAMMIAGISLVGASMRRRKTVGSFSYDQ